MPFRREHGEAVSAGRQELRAFQNAIRSREAWNLLAALTRQRPTFTAGQLRHALAKEIEDTGERARFTAQILGHAEIVRLSDRPDGFTTRYTTRAVLEAERQVLRDAEFLARNARHAVSRRRQASVLNHPRFAKITAEQLRALRHATGAGGLALIDGIAGVGKSFVLAAIRAAYQAAGYRAVGLGPTNVVAQDLRRDGFTHAATLHSELYALDRGRARWDAKTVVIVDEAAMIDTDHLARLAARARAAGAKLILAGDDRQLPSVVRGGLFAVLRARHGAAMLTDIKRQQRDDERRASKLLAEGKFADALRIYDGKGAIRWTQTQAGARAQLVQQWAEDSAIHPGKTRLVLAYTNADVAKLNAALRAVRKERGELGADHWFDTAYGRQVFAAGDDIQFCANAKRDGIVNGAGGHITQIDGALISVRLDGEDGPAVTFDAGKFTHFRHGYASTVHRSQGRTYDQAYLFYTRHWQAAASYVALTRHRERTGLFVARSAAHDLTRLALQMARIDDCRAASVFHPGRDPEPVRGCAGVGKRDVGPDDLRSHGAPAESFDTPFRRHEESDSMSWDGTPPGDQAPFGLWEARQYGRGDAPENSGVPFGDVFGQTLFPDPVPHKDRIGPWADRPFETAAQTHGEIQGWPPDGPWWRQPEESSQRQGTGIPLSTRSGPAAAPGDAPGAIAAAPGAAVGGIRQGTILGAIKASFRAAAAAVADHVPEALMPRARRRRGETSGDCVKPSVAAGSGGPAARGRYASLRTSSRQTGAKAAKLSRKFVRAAEDTALPEIFGAAECDAACGWDPFDITGPWYNHDSMNDGFGPPQGTFSPSL